METESMLGEEEGTSHREIIQTCLKELLDLLETENPVETNLKCATETLHKYLYTLFLHLLKQEKTLRLGPSSTMSYGVVNVKSFQETKQVLRDNLSYLTENTCDWPKLKTNLLQWGLLSTSDIQKLDKVPDDVSRHFEMYNIIAKKPDWPKKLLQCLRSSNNDHIAEVVSEGLTMLEKNQSKQKEIYLIQKEEIITRKEKNSSQVEQVRNFIETNRTNRNSVEDEIARARAREVELQAQIETLERKVKEGKFGEAIALAVLKIIGTENKVALIEELEELKKLNIKLQNERDGIQDELEILKRLLQEKNNELERLKRETEILEEDLKKLINVKLELQGEIDELNLNYNAEKTQNEETMNLLVKIKLQNVDEVLKLQKRIEILEAERHQLLLNQLYNPETELYKNTNVQSLNTQISNLHESAQDMSRATMINCNVDPSDQLWELYYSRLIVERELELNELKSRFNSTMIYTEIHQDLIKIHRSTCRVYGTKTNESSGEWTNFRKERLQELQAQGIQKDRFGCSVDFYKRIRRQYVEDNEFKNKIRYKRMRLPYPVEFMRKENTEYKNIQLMTKGTHANRLNELHQGFGQIELRRFETYPCGCPCTDSILPCVRHAILFRCFAIDRLSGNTTLVRKKREPNYLSDQLSTDYQASDAESEDQVEGGSGI